MLDEAVKGSSPCTGTPVAARAGDGPLDADVLMESQLKTRERGAMYKRWSNIKCSSLWLDSIKVIGVTENPIHDLKSRLKSRPKTIQGHL